MNYYELDTFTQAYITCALWSSIDNDVPLDSNHDGSDIHSESLAHMAKDCDDFRILAAEDLARAYAQRKVPYSDEQAGHDFWLNRNHHGAGFWDRGLGRLGDRLSDAAHSYGDSDLYVGDDGQLYVYFTSVKGICFTPSN